MIIQHKSGSTILNSQGTPLECLDFDYSGTHMVDRKITAVIQSSTPIDFAIGDKVHYKGQDFFIQSIPTLSRIFSSHMLSYTIVFWWTGYELQLVSFLDVVSNEPDRIYYSSNPTVTFTGTAKQLMDRIIANLNRVYLVRSGQGTDWYESWHYSFPVGFDFSVVKVITADNINCYEALQLLTSLFSIEFIFSPTRMILCGYTATLLNSTSWQFEYGKDKGLCEINRLQNTAKIITRVRAFGSTRNVPANYHTLAGSHEYHPRIILPNAGMLVDPVTGNRYFIQDGYIQDIALFNIYGIREEIYINEEIYPTIGSPALTAVDPVLDTDAVFKVHITNTGFDVFAKEINTGVTPKMSFKTGQFQGTEFEITKYEIGAVQTTVTLLRNSSDAAHLLPSSIIKCAVNDVFVLLDINLPPAAQYKPAHCFQIDVD